MAMEIISNYSNYVANYDDTTKKSNKKSNSNAATRSEDKIQEYYEQLCKKFSKMDFNTSGDIASSSKHNFQYIYADRGRF